MSAEGVDVGAVELDPQRAQRLLHGLHHHRRPGEVDVAVAEVVVLARGSQLLQRVRDEAVRVLPVVHRCHEGSVQGGVGQPGHEVDELVPADELVAARSAVEDPHPSSGVLGRAVGELGDLPADLVGEAERAALGERAAALEAMGAPTELAHRAAALETLAAAGDLALAAEVSGCTIGSAARLYFRLGERLSLALLANAAHKLPREGLWPSQAALAMQDELAALHADLLRSALRAGSGTDCDPDAAIATWSEPRRLALERVDRLLKEELASAGAIDLAMLSVATAELRTLV